MTTNLIDQAEGVKVITRRFFGLLSFASILGAWTHGTTSTGSIFVVDDLGNLVIDDLGNQVITS